MYINWEKPALNRLLLSLIFYFLFHISICIFQGSEAVYIRKSAQDPCTCVIFGHFSAPSSITCKVYISYTLLSPIYGKDEHARGLLLFNIRDARRLEEMEELISYQKACGITFILNWNLRWRLPCQLFLVFCLISLLRWKSSLCCFYFFMLSPFY